MKVTARPSFIVVAAGTEVIQVLHDADFHNETPSCKQEFHKADHLGGVGEGDR